MSRLSTVATAAFVALQVCSASAQQRYDLRPRFAAGQRWAEERTQTFEITTTVKSGQQVLERNQQSNRQVLEIEWEVLAIKDGVPTAARVAFGPKCGSEVTQNGQTQTMRFAAAGTTVEARLLPDGDVEYKPAGAGAPEVAAVFEDLFEINTGAYPRQPVAVGESWLWDNSAVIDAFDIGPDDQGSVKCTLKSVANEQGREIGNVEFRIELKQGAAQEGEGRRIATLTETNLTGTGRLDIAAGRMIELKLTGEVVMSGLVYGTDEAGHLTPQADINGSGRVGMEAHARLLGGNAPSPTAAPPAGGADYAGEYANPEMKLLLTKSADGFTGTIRMNEREFPVRAKPDGAMLKGAFESEGHWFDFTATLAGTTLTLATGGKTHTLQKKVAPVNPLGETTPANPLGGGAPENPLGGGGSDAGSNRPTPPPSGEGGGSPPRSLAARSYDVFRCVDERGFHDASGRPLEIFHMLLPHGWRFEGGLTWKINQRDVTTLSRVDLVNPADLSFRVLSPDERVVIQAYPEVHFADLRGSPAYNMGMFAPGSDYGGFVVAEVMDPASYITQFVIPRQRGGLQDARIVESKEIPSLAQRYDREAAITTAALQAAGAGGISHRAAMIMVEHQIGGRVFHEAFVVVLGYLQTPGITMWSSRLNLSMRAPREEVEQWRPVIATILGSIEFNMRWVGEYIRLQKRAEGVIIDVDRFCQQVDADITRNRAETNAQIHRDMYPRLAPFCDHTGPDGNRYFLETDLQHQMNERGVIRSDISLPDEAGWTNMPEYTGP